MLGEKKKLCQDKCCLGAKTLLHLEIRVHTHNMYNKNMNEKV